MKGVPSRTVGGGPGETRAVLRSIYVCFFLSGALGLIYEILWLRKLLLVFGSSVHAVSTVLTVFFGGLALGSWIFGRLIDRHEGAGLRWYAALEAGIGLFAFLSLPLFEVIQRIYIPVYQASGFSPTALVGASFVCSVLILLLPTTLLGATFPILGRFLIRTSEERGGKIASLYGINTAGAMAGTLFVYYVGLPALGLVRTMWCAGVLNLGIGALCFVFDRHLEGLGFRIAPKPATGESPPMREEPLGAVRWLFVAFGLSGFSAMAYEVAWTRALSMVLGSSIYAFCIMLATFLGGIALGSLRVRRDLQRRPATVRMFIQIELLLGLYGLCSILLFSQLPDWFVMFWPLTGQTFSGILWLQFLLSALAMLLPALLMGCLFPVVSDLVTRRFAQLGQRLGTAYAVNTGGGIIGSFLAGFVLIPLWGLHWAVIGAALVNFIAAFLLYARFGESGSFARRLALTTAALIGVIVLSKAVVAPFWQQQVFAEGVYLRPGEYRHTTVQQAAANTELLYYRDGLNTTVSVHQRGETLFLKVGGKTDASTGIDMATQVLLAHIPLLLHQDPHRVLVIGLGSGVTLGSAGRHAVSVLHCAEIDEAVVEGARWFREHNDGIHDDPRVRMFVVDGRNFLLASQEQYDVIISEPSNPWMAGLAYLFTQEFYQLAKQRLAPGGIMCQWIHLYRIFPGDVKLMLRTFHEEFPYVSVWSSFPGDLLLVGSMEPHQFEYATLRQRMMEPKVKESLARVRVDRPSLLLQLFWFGTDEVERLTANVEWIHQDNQPWVEFNAPKALYSSLVSDVNIDGLGRFKGEPQGIAPDYDPLSEEDAGFHLALGELQLFRQERGQAQAAFERAAELAPDSSVPLVRVAELYLGSRQDLKAQEVLTKAVRLNPRAAKAYRLLGRLSWRQGDLDAAKGFYTQAARWQIPDSETAEEIGHSLREASEFSEAAEYYRSSISQGGGARRELIVAYAQALRELEEWPLAEQVLAFGIARFQEDPIFPVRLGELLLDQDRALEAQPLFEQALSIESNSAEAHVGLGRIALQQGEVEEAARSLRKGLQYDPYHQEALELLYQIQQTQT